MDEVMRLAVTLAEAAALRRARPVVPRHLAGIVLALAVAGMAAVSAVGCALAGLWLAALPWAGPAGAPLIVAGTLLAAALIALSVAWHLRQPRPSTPTVDATALVLAALMAGLSAGTRAK